MTTVIFPRSRGFKTPSCFRKSDVPFTVITSSDDDTMEKCLTDSLSPSHQNNQPTNTPKKPRGMKRKDTEEEIQKERRRRNKFNRERKKYGLHGFLLSMLVTNGATIVFDKVTGNDDKMKNRKLEINQIIMNDYVVLDRKEMENEEKESIKDDALTHSKQLFRECLNVIIDNRLVEIIGSMCRFMKTTIKKQPTRKYIPQRITIVELVDLMGKTYQEKEMIENGLFFYHRLKSEFGGFKDVSLDLSVFPPV